MVSERTRGRELTEEEQTEYDALKAKLTPTTPVPTTPEEQAAAVEAETDRLLKLGYEEADARAQAEANVSFQVAEDEEIRKDETDRVNARKEFATIYDEYLAAGYSEEEATLRAVETLDEQLTAAKRAAEPETADVTGQETGPVTVNQLAREEQKRAGWSEAWPFIPADLGNSDFRQLLRDDPNISPEEKVQIFEAGYKLGVVPRQEVADVIDLGGPVD
jgi:hypothetical protein